MSRRACLPKVLGGLVAVVLALNSPGTLSAQPVPPSPLERPRPISSPPPPAGLPTFIVPQPSFDFTKAYPMPPGQVSIVGTVTSQASGRPVSGATIQLLGTPFSAISDARGHFEFPRLPSRRDNPAVHEVVARASGFGIFKIDSVPLFDRHRLTLAIELPPTGQTARDPGLPVSPRGRGMALRSIRAASANAELAAHSAGETGEGEMVAASLVTAVMQTTIASQTTPPPYIRVGRNPNPGVCPVNRSTTSFATVTHVAFRDYVKSVLPNEWVPNWEPAALQAGAMAVKNYAWAIVNAGGDWANADVDDSICNQVYRTAVRDSATDEAVDATFTDGFYRDGLIFPSEYIDGTPGSPSPCSVTTGQCYPGRMSQHGSQYLALQGSTYRQIVDYYYNTAPSGQPSNISFVTLKPPAPEIVVASVTEGQNATFSFATPGATAYYVQQYNYATGMWNSLPSGLYPVSPDGTVVVPPAGDGTNLVALSVTAANSAGRSPLAYNGGFTVADVSFSPVPAPTVRGKDLTDVGMCLTIHDAYLSVTSYRIYQAIQGPSLDGPWTYLTDVDAGVRDADCELDANPPAGTTSVFVAIPYQQLGGFLVQAVSGEFISMPTEVDASPYPPGY